jgi:hypothetical protein
MSNWKRRWTNPVAGPRTHCRGQRRSIPIYSNQAGIIATSVKKSAFCYLLCMFSPLCLKLHDISLPRFHSGKRSIEQ